MSGCFFLKHGVHVHCAALLHLGICIRTRRCMQLAGTSSTHILLCQNAVTGVIIFSCSCFVESCYTNFWSFTCQSVTVSGWIL